jgi:hypothetical protein
MAGEGRGKGLGLIVSEWWLDGQAARRFSEPWEVSGACWGRVGGVHPGEPLRGDRWALEENLFEVVRTGA